jgi:N-acyl-D-aspartate/D-glutamate deacylase
MQTLLTRRDDEGNVWGARQAIDRKTALIMMTRGGADYLLREDRLGAIEPGKLADLAVFDGDWLTTPETHLADLATLLTISGGKVVYVDPAFAAKVGPSLDRIMHPHAAKFPAFRPNDEMKQWQDKRTQ